MNNLELVKFWTREIQHSQQFYIWLKALIDMRYSQKGVIQKQEQQ
jgi:hypothetical protein